MDRVPTWPDDRQHELAEIALEIEAELATAEYQATPDELAAIDEGLTGGAVSEEDVIASIALFKADIGSNVRSLPSPTFDKSPLIMSGLAMRRSLQELRSAFEKLKYE